MVHTAVLGMLNARIGIPVSVDPSAWIFVDHMIGLRERGISVREEVLFT